MTVLSGATLLLPNRPPAPGTLIIEDGRIADVRGGDTSAPPTLRGHFVAPGFIDVHIHGVEGHDTLEAGESIAEIARRLPRYGVTAFCPTTVACHPAGLRRVLNAVRDAQSRPPSGARVLAAHLESNFINPEYKGAQPLACLRLPPQLDGRTRPAARRPDDAAHEFSAEDILAEIDAARRQVGIVTLAPELAGSLDLIADLTARGHCVSLGHSGATYEQALDAIRAGARHATHVFNRMPPLTHRSPGLVGAVLASDALTAEIICDGYHVHPAVVRFTIAAKGVARVIAITDGTAGSGMPLGTRARLGSQTITVSQHAALLDDGTLAGSVLTLDRGFRMLVEKVGLTPSDAAQLCSTTPARQLGLDRLGAIEPGAEADLVVLSDRFEVVQTFVAGVCVYSAFGANPPH